MHGLERQRLILEALQLESFLSVEQLQERLNASPATIRRDFTELAEKGLVVRGHGGIHRLENAPVMGVVPISRRRVEHPAEKECIARAAASLLYSSDIVIIDGGSTTAGLANYLSPHIRVITNSLPLATALNKPQNPQSPAPEVNVTGGYLYPKSEVLLGPQTVLALREYQANWCFLGTSGVTVGGILNSNNMVVDTQREMIARSEKVAILADASKFNYTAMVRVCPLSTVDVLVTNQQPDKRLEEALIENDVQILVAAKNE
ncbi:MAG: DeoR/GlpR family DNA-binding transcription regulator [Sumerlaeia bacterium]